MRVGYVSSRSDLFCGEIFEACPRHSNTVKPQNPFHLVDILGAFPHSPPLRTTHVTLLARSLSP